MASAGSRRNGRGSFRAVNSISFSIPNSGKNEKRQNAKNPGKMKQALFGLLPPAIGFAAEDIFMYFKIMKGSTLRKGFFCARRMGAEKAGVNR